MAHVPHTILVTGGAGFIGSNYLLHMVPRYPLVKFVNLDALTYAGNPANLKEVEDAANYMFEHGDVAEPVTVRDVFARHEPDTVVHFAAESHVDRSILAPSAFIRTNVIGTATILDAARDAWKDRADVRLHHISTDEVFGSLGMEGHFTPTTPYAPRSPYAASKAASDHLVRAWGETFKLPYVITNTSNNYGPFQFPEKLIPLVIANAVAGEAIPVYGKGENVRDWLFVKDHCEALEAVLLSGKTGSTYLIGGSEERTNLELVHLILDQVDRELDRPLGSGRKLITFVKDRPGHDFRYALDSSATEEELGWKPRHTLESGLQETVRWYLDNAAWLESVRNESYRTYYAKQYSQ